MGLIVSGRLGERLRARIDTLYWRARYWWMDTEGGAQAKLAGFGITSLIVVLDLIKVSIAALVPPPPGEPHKAVIWWVVYLVVALIAAAVSYALRPKIEQQQQAEAQGPTSEDGQAGIVYWGTHWATDTFWLAWMMVGRDPIKGKGGK